MIKRILILVAIVVAGLSVTQSSAESLCADAGAIGLVPVSGGVINDGGFRLDPVCVPVP